MVEVKAEQPLWKTLTALGVRVNSMPGGLQGHVSKAEGHDEALIVTSGGDEGCLPLVTFQTRTRL